MSGNLKGMVKSNCTGAGKYSVASKTAYWNYYIPATCLFGLWPKDVPVVEMEQ